MNMRPDILHAWMGRVTYKFGTPIRKPEKRLHEGWKRGSFVCDEEGKNVASEGD